LIHEDTHQDHIETETTISSAFSLEVKAYPMRYEPILTRLFISMILLVDSSRGESLIGGETGGPPAPAGGPPPPAAAPAGGPVAPGAADTPAGGPVAPGEAETPAGGPVAPGATDTPAGGPVAAAVGLADMMEYVMKS
jgi:hypothetical protein